MLNVPTVTAVSVPVVPVTVSVADARVSFVSAPEPMLTMPSCVPVIAASAVAGCVPE